MGVVVEKCGRDYTWRDRLYGRAEAGKLTKKTTHFVCQNHSKSGLGNRLFCTQFMIEFAPFSGVAQASFLPGDKANFRPFYWSNIEQSRRLRKLHFHG